MSAASETQQAQYTLENVSGVPVVTLSKELANARVGVVEELGNEIVAKIAEMDARDMLVDISSMQFVGSALVALVVRLWKSIRDKEGRTVVAVGSPAVQEVLTIARLHEHWILVPTVEAGCKKLKLSARPTGAPAGPAPANNVTPPAPVAAPPSRQQAAAPRPAAAPAPVPASVGGARNEGEAVSPVMAVIAVLGMVTAICGTALIGVRSPLVPAMTALLITLGASVLGLIVGTVLLTKGNTFGRSIGGLAVLICAASVLTGIVLHGSPADSGTGNPTSDE